MNKFKINLITGKMDMVGVADPPETPIQSDWNQEDNTAPDFIENKPSLGSMASKDFWTGTQAAYDLIDPKNANTIYYVEEE